MPLGGAGEEIIWSDVEGASIWETWTPGSWLEKDHCFYPRIISFKVSKRYILKASSVKLVLAPRELNDSTSAFSCAPLLLVNRLCSQPPACLSLSLSSCSFLSLTAPPVFSTFSTEKESPLLQYVAGSVLVSFSNTVFITHCDMNKSRGQDARWKKPDVN